MFTATPELRVSYKFHSAFLYGHLLSSYRPYWDKCTKMTLRWPQTTKPQSASIKLGFTDFQNCHILTWNLGTGKSSWSYTYVLFLLPRGRNWAYFSVYGKRFLWYGYIIKISIFGHETWPLAKVPEVACILSFCPRGLEFRLFSP